MSSYTKELFELVQKLEKENNIKIIYAVEVGPKAYGGEEFSDVIEMKFLYIYPLTDYLNIDDTNLKEKIQLSKDKIDISGLEFKKALKLLLDFNIPVLEWLQSKQIYYEEKDTIEELRQYVKNVFSKYKSLQYFSSIAKRIWVSSIKDKKEVEPINYFIVMKQLLSIDYLMKYDEFPPYHIKDLSVNFDEEKKLFELIRSEKVRIDLADQWIMKKRKEYEKIKKNEDVSIDESVLNKIFRKVVKNGIYHFQDLYDF